eukprot:GHVS01033381.1.p1 GENE.GHVS01033381.1~~GHVS01033381.1.p1  ORF type:complete len:995 (-),score=199.09 GHVS01033381.1:142-2730(-)
MAARLFWRGLVPGGVLSGTLLSWYWKASRKAELLQSTVSGDMVDELLDCLNDRDELKRSFEYHSKRIHAFNQQKFGLHSKFAELFLSKFHYLRVDQVKAFKYVSFDLFRFHREEVAESLRQSMECLEKPQFDRFAILSEAVLGSSTAALSVVRPAWFMGMYNGTADHVREQLYEKKADWYRGEIDNYFEMCKSELWDQPQTNEQPAPPPVDSLLDDYDANGNVLLSQSAFDRAVLYIKKCHPPDIPFCKAALSGDFPLANNEHMGKLSKMKRSKFLRLRDSWESLRRAALPPGWELLALNQTEARRAYTDYVDVKLKRIDTFRQRDRIIGLGNELPRRYTVFKEEGKFLERFGEGLECYAVGMPANEGMFYPAVADVEESRTAALGTSFKNMLEGLGASKKSGQEEQMDIEIPPDWKPGVDMEKYKTKITRQVEASVDKALRDIDRSMKSQHDVDSATSTTAQKEAPPPDHEVSKYFTTKPPAEKLFYPEIQLTPQTPLRQEHLHPLAAKVVTTAGGGGEWTVPSADQQNEDDSSVDLPSGMDIHKSYRLEDIDQQVPEMVREMCRNYTLRILQKMEYNKWVYETGQFDKVQESSYYDDEYKDISREFTEEAKKEKEDPNSQMQDDSQSEDEDFQSPYEKKPEEDKDEEEDSEDALFERIRDEPEWRMRDPEDNIVHTGETDEEDQSDPDTRTWPVAPVVDKVETSDPLTMALSMGYQVVLSTYESVYEMLAEKGIPPEAMRRQWRLYKGPERPMFESLTEESTGKVIPADAQFECMNCGFTSFPPTGQKAEGDKTPLHPLLNDNLAPSSYKCMQCGVDRDNFQEVRHVRNATVHFVAGGGGGHRGSTASSSRLEEEHSSQS